MLFQNKNIENKTTKNQKIFKCCCYVVGSVALFAITCAVMPKIQKKLTNCLYKASMSTEYDFNDFEPEVIKTNNSVEKNKED